MAEIWLIKSTPGHQPKRQRGLPPLGRVHAKHSNGDFFIKYFSIGPERAWKVRARVGLGLLRAWPGGQAWGLACGLSPKTRPVQAQAFGLCSKSPSPSPQCGLGPGPAPALLFGGRCVLGLILRLWVIMVPSVLCNTKILSSPLKKSSSIIQSWWTLIP
jgi:hypothetical protein